MKTCLVHHVHIFCTDLEAMITFWQDGFGLPLLRRREFRTGPGVEMDMGGGVLLVIVQCSQGKYDASAAISGVDHLGIRVQDLDAALKRAAAVPGVRITREPFMSETLRCAFVAGPDDVQVEIVQPGS